MAGKVNGFVLAYGAIGGVVLWSGIKGETLSQTFRGLLQGQGPSINQEPITGSAASSPQAEAANTAAETASAGVGASGPVTASTVTSRYITLSASIHCTRAAGEVRIYIQVSVDLRRASDHAGAREIALECFAQLPSPAEHS